MSFFASRASLVQLSRLCRHVGTAAAAGIDERTVWARQAERTTGPMRPHIERVRASVATGGAVADALREAGAFFPEVFVRLVDAGERGGALPEVLLRLADYYDHRITVRRTFLTRLAWPAVQLTVALIVVGILIWFPSYVAQGRPGQVVDFLGLGLLGTRGLAVYVAIVAAAFWVTFMGIHGIVRGAPWARRLESLVLAIPGVGTPWRTIGLARLTWALRLMLNSALDVKEAVALALATSGLRWYSEQTNAIVAALDRGAEIHEAFQSTRAFPQDFLDALAVAEQSGQLVEYTERLSRDYERRADDAFKALAAAASFVIWALVAALLVTLIFRLAFSYFGLYSRIPKL